MLTWLKQDPQEQIVDFLLGVLANAESEAIQATTALGLAKLMIAGILNQERVNKLFLPNPLLTCWAGTPKPSHGLFLPGDYW